MNTEGRSVFLLLTFVLLIAAIYDIRFRKIPNWLTFSTMGWATVYHVMTSGFEGFLFSIGGLCVGIATLIVFYLIGGMGAGDVKLMGAIGGVLGPKGVITAFLFTGLIGGIYALFLLFMQGCLKEALYRYWTVLKTFFLTGQIIYVPPSEKEKRPRLQYGIAIALGTFGSQLMRNMI